MKSVTTKCWKSLMESSTQLFEKEWNEVLSPKLSGQRSGLDGGKKTT